MGDMFVFYILHYYTFSWLAKHVRNYSGMLIGRPIVILCIIARKITAEDAEVRREISSSASLRALCGDKSLDYQTVPLDPLIFTPWLVLCEISVACFPDVAESGAD